MKENKKANCVTLNKIQIEFLNNIVVDYYHFNTSYIVQRNWVIKTEIDNNAIYDEDAENFSNAMHRVDADKYFLIRTEDILEGNYDEILCFPSSVDGVEEFQKEKWYDYNLHNCLIFDESLNFVIHRTGGTDFTSIASSQEFIDIATANWDESETREY